MSALSQALIDAMENDPRGLCGQHEPAYVVGQLDDLEHRLHALTLGAILGVFSQSEHWLKIAQLDTHWILDSSQVAYRSSTDVLAVLKQEKLVGPRHQARVWWQICRGIQGRFKGSIRELLKANQEDARAISNYLTQHKTTFPVLSGPIIVNRWLDMIHRLGGVSLANWDELRIPLTASQREKAVQFTITDEQVHPHIRTALDLWQQACQANSEHPCGLTNCPRRGKMSGNS